MNDRYDVERLKSSLNIVDVISNYVQLKKNGKNYFACCPFHGEKTASFSVEEDDQFYHCFGCGAHGDAIKFVMDIENIEFIDSVKKLGGELEYKPSSEIISNIKRNSLRSKYKLPDDHKQDIDLCKLALSKCKIDSDSITNKYDHKNGFLYPVTTPCNQLVNLVDFSHGKLMRFAADGPSYNGFTNVNINGSNNYIACTSIADARLILTEYNRNVALCWSDAVMKYICMWNHGDLNIIPAISESDDDYLCYEMDWIKITKPDNNKPIKLEKMEMLK